MCVGVGVLGESTWVSVCATTCMGVCVKVGVSKCVCQSERVCECVSTLKAFSTVISKSGNSSILIKRDQAMKKNIPPSLFYPFPASIYYLSKLKRTLEVGRS